MTPDRSQLVEGIRNCFRSLARMDPKSLPATADGAVAREYLGEVISLSNRALELPIEEIPAVFLKPLRDRVQNFAAALQDQIAAARRTATPGTPPEDIRHRIESGFIELYREVMASFSYLGYVAADLGNAKSKADEILRGLGQDRSNFGEQCRRGLDELATVQGESRQFLEVLRRTAAATGAGTHSKEFDGIAAMQARAGHRWLIAATVLAVATLAAATVFLWLAPPIGKLSEAAAIQELVSRVVIIGLLLVGTAWCGKVFRVRMHLAETNRHRGAALKTFELFHASAHSNDVREEVLKAATTCVFSPGITGFIDAKEEHASNELLELLRILPLPGKS